MIELTEAAAHELRSAIKANDAEGKGLRIRAVPGGCAGMQYGLGFDDEPAEGDETFESQGLRIFVAKAELLLLDGSKVDFVESAMGKGFAVDNPNVPAGSGCGSCGAGCG